MEGVAVHWAVIPAPADHADCPVRFQQIIDQHAGQGYNPTPAYNWIVCPHGQEYEGRGWGQLSAANGTNQANQDWWAICALNAPGDVPSDAMLATISRLAHEAPNAPYVLAPHSDFFQTACPGDELRTWIANGAPNPTPPTHGGDMLYTIDEQTFYAYVPTVGWIGSSPPLRHSGIPYLVIDQAIYDRMNTTEGAPGNGLTEAQVRAIVREEIDRPVRSTSVPIA